MDDTSARPHGRAKTIKGTFLRERQLEHELHETLKRYEVIFRATHDVLYDLNFHTSKVVWNEALYTEYGYSENEPAGTLEWWTSRIHPDDALGVEHAVTELLESQENNWNYDYRFQKADGSYVDVRDRGFILRAPDGTPLRIIGSFLDISRQKQLERAKDEFSSLISHQLRTPLTVIRIYSDLLAGGTFGDLAPAQLTEIQKIQDSSVKLIELVNDILAISSIELQTVKLVATATDINKLIAKCVEEVGPLAQAKAVTISFSPNTKLKPITADPKILEQIIHNLLTNAIRYTGRESGRIVAKVASQDDGYVISVKDNGIGIPLADQPHVFDRFYRANNAVNTEEHGTGLGLYYVQLVTKTFGGRVWFKSVQDKGTTFYLFVPGAVL